ncbi:hypothetical protein FRC09_000807 [Ceratobasidium sp. 395]|nr:hypothetical protein FRC09_000807 [Ceratobasidium sp. 395]
MPKREKTPPPGDDEPTYLRRAFIARMLLTFSHEPHSLASITPSHPISMFLATLDEERNVKECARWLACFVGQDNLYSLFHKPSVRADLEDSQMRNILGEHEWSKVFVKRESEEITSSKIFYSTFKSRRDVEKTGWKPVDIVDEYFKNFNPSKGGKCAHPYPDTHFCEPPLLTGEVSALRLFKSLPVKLFPEAARNQPQAPAPVAPTPPSRVVPGSAPASGGGNSTGGKGKKGKGKGNGPNLDPIIHTATPITRSLESSAKAKATFRQAPVVAKMYEEDSDDDGANYIPAHPGPGPANWSGAWDDGAKKEDEVLDEKYEPQEPSTQPGLTSRFTGIEVEEDDGPMCPHHNERCKPGICEWANEEKRKKKRIQNRSTPSTGQNLRQF